MAKKKRTTIRVDEKDIKKPRIPLPIKTEKVHKHRKDRRAQLTKKDILSEAEEE